MRTILSRTHKDQAGQALPLFGIMVFVLLGFVAMSIDVGRYVWARTSMQAGVDAAAIAAAQMMLEHLGEADAAGLIEKAIKKVVSQDLKSLSAGHMGYSTTEVGDLAAKYISG